MTDGTDPAVDAVPVQAGARVPGGRTNAYVVGETAALLVDPAARTPELTSLVESRDVAHVAVTHTHPDHVGSVADFSAGLGATVWGRVGREERFEAVAGIAPDRTFREGTRVGPATVIETPGHASDHVAFAAGSAALVGDVAFATGSVVIGSSGDMRAYLTTLRRLRVRGFTRLYPGHGPPIEDPAARLDQLLRHRLDREAMVLAAVRDGARTPGAIVDAVYEDDLGDVRDLAVSTVESHLEKLAVEGDLAWESERAVPR